MTDGEKTDDLEMRTAYADPSRLRQASQSGRSPPEPRPSLDSWADDSETRQALDRTSRAHDAAVMTIRFAQSFGKRAFGAPPGYILHVQEPEETTAGGAKARLPITMVPQDRSGRSIVLGWLDSIEHRIEIRSFEVLSQMIAARRLPLTFPPQEYHQLGDDMSQFAQSNGMTLQVRDALERTPSVARPSPVPEQGMSLRSAVIVGLLLMIVGLCAGVALFLASSP